MTQNGDSKIDPEESVLRRKLVLDGDGVGEDRKLQQLAKQFAKLLYSKSLNHEQLDAELEKIRLNVVSSLVDMIRSYATLDTIACERQELIRSMKEEQQSLEDNVKEVEILRGELDYLKKLIRVQDQPSRENTRSNLEMLETKRSTLLKRVKDSESRQATLERIENSIKEYLGALES